MAATRDSGSLSDPGGLTIALAEQGTTTTIELRGECDLASLPAVCQAISAVLDDLPECIVLDLSRLGFIDSTGLHATIELRERSAAQNARLVIVPGPEPVQRLFEITGLLERFQFIDKRPGGSTVARPRTAQDCTAGSGAFSPPASGAGRLRQAAGAAPSDLSPQPRAHSHRAPSGESRRWPGAESRP